MLCCRMLAVALAICLAPSAQAQKPLSDGEMLSFLVQCIGTDARGKPVFPSPSRPACPSGGSQEVSTGAGWRKHDWGTLGPEGRPKLGHQVSDSVLVPGLARPVVVQTFDFGDGERRFGRFDRGIGDGGDLIALVEGAAYGVFTEDGGSGQQWFVSEHCRDEPESGGRLKAWLFFGRDVDRADWTEAVARLNIVRSPSECPARFGSAYTRYRRDIIDVPFRIVDGDKPGANSRRPVDSVVSDHFGGDSVAKADHLERFYFGRGLGKYRWERWENLSRSSLKDAASRADVMANSGRCMPLAYSDAPGPDWAMVDCRTWTTLVRQRQPWSVARFGWPGAEVLDSLR